MYNVIDIAKYIILFCKKYGYSISNLKLQKLLYFVQAQFLIYGRPAFNEDIEAWDFGPVVPEAYQCFKIWGNSEIPKFVMENVKEKIYDSDQQIIDEILKECAPNSAATLVSITHNQAPWTDSYEKYCNNVISKKSIKEYFEKN